MNKVETRMSQEMATTDPPVTFGYPEYWEKAYTQHQKFFECLPRLQQSIDSLTLRGHANVEPYKRVILNLGMMVNVGLIEVVTLVGNGLGQGAMKIVRNLVENAINAEYLRRAPLECDDFLEWIWVEDHKTLIYLKNNRPEEIKKRRAEHVAKKERQYLRVKPRFTYTGKDGRSHMRKQWCRLNLAERAKVADFTPLYELIMDQANQLLHGTIRGMIGHTGPDNAGDRIDFPPSKLWTNEALIVVHEATIRTVDTLSKTLGIEPHPTAEVLMSDHRKAWT